MFAADKLFQKIKPKFDDDSVDRFNYLYTPATMGVFALTIVAKQYVGKPLQCWVPPEFQEQWEKYSEEYCFIENTYFVGNDEKFPKTAEEREARELLYYQWVPFILVLQMILFMLPKFFWNSLNWKTGLCISQLIQTSRFTIKKDKKKVLVGTALGLKAANQLSKTVTNQKNTPNDLSSKYMQTKNRYFVTCLYLFYKLCNIFVCFIQLYFLNEILSPNYQFWGIGILQDLLANRRWQQSGHFPRVAFCDVKIRDQGGRSMEHTFQCALMINMFNEKIFIFLWFWLVFLAILDTLNFVHWLYLIIVPGATRDFIYSKLKANGRNCDQPIKLKEFIQKNLTPDAITALRLVSCNSGHLISSDLITGLWDRFYQTGKVENKSDEKIPVKNLENGIPNQNFDSLPKPYNSLRKGGQNEELSKPSDFSIINKASYPSNNFNGYSTPIQNPTFEQPTRNFNNMPTTNTASAYIALGPTGQPGLHDNQSIKSRNASIHSHSFQ